MFGSTLDQPDFDWDRRQRPLLVGMDAKVEQFFDDCATNDGPTHQFLASNGSPMLYNVGAVGFTWVSGV